MGSNNRVTKHLTIALDAFLEASFVDIPYVIRGNTSHLFYPRQLAEPVLNFVQTSAENLLIYYKLAFLQFDGVRMAATESFGPFVANIIW
jgi:hypothetical protein